MFKYVNKQKEKIKTKSEIIDLFKTLMLMFAKPENLAKFYYEIYIANYRPNGDYENLTKQEFKHYKDFKQKRTPNNSAYEYSAAKLPFKGSNLEGYWDTNEKNEWYYEVTSYGWYPIYLFLNDQWYRVSNRYSSSTAKHLAGADPFRKNYDPNIKDQVIMVTPEEIKNIRDGKPMSDIKTKRISGFMDEFGRSMNTTNPTKLITIGWGEDKKKIKYTIEKVEDKNDKIYFTIRIDRAGKVEGTNKMVVNPEGYIVPSPFSEDIENGIKDFILYTYSNYLKTDNTDFKFTHPNN